MVARLIEMIWLKMMSRDVVRVLCAHACFSKLAATFRLLSARAFDFNALIACSLVIILNIHFSDF